jgi:diguanylate cyclase (GGDEF)-like protein
VEKQFAEESSTPEHNKLTISCGVASYPEDAMTKDDLITMADAALYQAKRAGKNRTCVYSKAIGEKKLD